MNRFVLAAVVLFAASDLMAARPAARSSHSVKRAALPPLTTSANKPVAPVGTKETKETADEYSKEYLEAKTTFANMEKAIEAAKKELADANKLDDGDTSKPGKIAKATADLKAAQDAYDVFLETVYPGIVARISDTIQEDIDNDLRKYESAFNRVKSICENKKAYASMETASKLVAAALAGQGVSVVGGTIGTVGALSSKGKVAAVGGDLSAAAGQILSTITSFSALNSFKDARLRIEDCGKAVKRFYGDLGIAKPAAAKGKEDEPATFTSETFRAGVLEIYIQSKARDLIENCEAANDKVGMLKAFEADMLKNGYMSIAGSAAGVAGSVAAIASQTDYDGKYKSGTDKDSATGARWVAGIGGAGGGILGLASAFGSMNTLVELTEVLYAAEKCTSDWPASAKESY